MGDTAEALIYTAAGCAEIRPVSLAPMRVGMAEVRTLHSALSRGTERLVFNGDVPQGEWQTMRAPFQEGEFPFPVKYGYAAVGVVEAGPAWLVGRTVFALHPHQTRFRVPKEAVVPLPDGVPPERAVLGANAETALNGIWDAELRPASRVLVLGAGLLGSLIAAFLSRRGDMIVDVSDLDPARQRVHAEFNTGFVPPADLPDTYDVVFHTTASAGGLASALDALVFEGRVIDLSWYGAQPVSVGLGERFHSRRLRIVSSQVGEVAPSRRASTSRRDRLALALALLDDPRLDPFVSETCRFDALPRRMSALLATDAPGIATRVDYD